MTFEGRERSGVANGVAGVHDGWGIDKELRGDRSRGCVSVRAVGD